MNLFSILMSENVVETINDNLDDLINLIPEIKPMIGFEQNKHMHHLDVWNHTLLSLSFSKNDFETRLVLLLHDIGKPFSYQEENNRFRYFDNHCEVSSQMTKDILDRFNFEKDFTEEVCRLIKMHDTPISIIDIKNNYEFFSKLYDIQCCNIMAKNPIILRKRVNYLKNVRDLLEVYKPRIKTHKKF